jgi:hypothetical protein
MTRSKYCSKCGLEYRKWSFAVENPACEECEPEKYKKIYKDNITQIKKRTLAQEHITEHTFFPGERVGPRWLNWRKTPDNRKRTK